MRRCDLKRGNLYLRGDPLRGFRIAYRAERIAAEHDGGIAVSLARIVLPHDQPHDFKRRINAFAHRLFAFEQKRSPFSASFFIAERDKFFDERIVF